MFTGVESGSWITGIRALFTQRMGYWCACVTDHFNCARKQNIPSALTT